MPHGFWARGTGSGHSGAPSMGKPGGTAGTAELRAALGWTHERLSDTSAGTVIVRMQVQPELKPGGAGSGASRIGQRPGLLLRSRLRLGGCRPLRRGRQTLPILRRRQERPARLPRSLQVVGKHQRAPATAAPTPSRRHCRRRRPSELRRPHRATQVPPRSRRGRGAGPGPRRRGGGQGAARGGRMRGGGGRRYKGGARRPPPSDEPGRGARRWAARGVPGPMAAAGRAVAAGGA